MRPFADLLPDWVVAVWQVQGQAESEKLNAANLVKSNYQNAAMDRSACKVGGMQPAVLEALQMGLQAAKIYCLMP